MDSTAEQHAAIRKAAQDWAAYIRWIAKQLTKTDDALIRKEAARLLLQLTEQ